MWLKNKEQLEQLVDARIASIAGYFNEIKIRDTKVEFVKDVQMVKPKKKKKRRRSKKYKAPPDPPIPNVTVTVGRIMKL